jgi:predicted GH43/DUF377 family glycosyl hydrolase
MRFFSITLLFFFACNLLNAQEKINFTKLTSPIIFQGDNKFAYRDPAVIYENDQFHIFFTLSENDEDGGYYNYVAYSVSRDLLHWSYPKILTPRDRKLNYSSPGNIIRYKDEWIICYQTYPTPELQEYGTRESRIWISKSADLQHWSEPHLLRVKGPNVVQADMGRMIDPYLLEDKNEPGKWWCFYKQNGVSMSYSYDLENWTYVGRADTGENVTVILQNDEYVMFHSPHNGIGVKRSLDPQKWGEDETLLTLGQKDWPWAQGRLTAATVIDLTQNPHVRKYIMFFHGSRPFETVQNRAHAEASLAIAWSDDLVDWNWPGKN